MDRSAAGGRTIIRSNQLAPVFGWYDKCRASVDALKYLPSKLEPHAKAFTGPQA